MMHQARGGPVVQGRENSGAGRASDGALDTADLETISASATSMVAGNGADIAAMLTQQPLMHVQLLWSCEGAPS